MIIPLPEQKRIIAYLDTIQQKAQALQRLQEETKQWQEAEKEASEDIKQGRMSPIFSSAKEGINYLKAITEKFTKTD